MCNRPICFPILRHLGHFYHRKKKTWNFGTDHPVNIRTGWPRCGSHLFITKIYSNLLVCGWTCGQRYCIHPHKHTHTQIYMQIHKHTLTRVDYLIVCLWIGTFGSHMALVKAYLSYTEMLCILKSIGNIFFYEELKSWLKKRENWW